MHCDKRGYFLRILFLVNHLRGFCMVSIRFNNQLIGFCDLLLAE